MPLISELQSLALNIAGHHLTTSDLLKWHHSDLIWNMEVRSLSNKEEHLG